MSCRRKSHGSTVPAGGSVWTDSSTEDFQHAPGMGNSSGPRHRALSMDPKMNFQSLRWQLFVASKCLSQNIQSSSVPARGAQKISHLTAHFFPLSGTCFMYRYYAIHGSASPGAEWVLLFPYPQLPPACLKATSEFSLAGEGLYLCVPLTAITAVKKQGTVPSLPTLLFSVAFI